MTEAICPWLSSLLSLLLFIMTINNKSERNYRGKCLGWPVTSYGGAYYSCKKMELNMQQTKRFRSSANKLCLEEHNASFPSDKIMLRATSLPPHGNEVLL